MSRFCIVSICLMMAALIAGCGSNAGGDGEMIGGADAPTSISLPADSGDTEESDIITDEQALLAIKNYCHINNPDLEEIEKAGEYPVYWEVQSSDGKEVVILFRSYTGALIRYYIDADSGETYVTEFVPGIMDEEERTDESFNVRDYL